MSDHHQAEGLDRHAAERLLDGADGHARLHALLAAAAAPARPGELAGEDAAVAAFTAAPRPARGSRAAALRRFLTIKVLTIMGGSLILTGGAAYATITGQFPGQDPAPAHSQVPDGHHGPEGDSTPATRPPSPRPSSTAAQQPSPTTSKAHGRPGAPGQTKKGNGHRTKAPKRTPEPTRGPGNNNGNNTNGGGGTGSGSGSGTGGGSTTSGGGLGGSTTTSGGGTGTGGGGSGTGSGTPAATDPAPGNGNGNGSTG